MAGIFSAAIRLGLLVCGAGSLCAEQPASPAFESSTPGLPLSRPLQVPSQGLGLSDELKLPPSRMLQNQRLDSLTSKFTTLQTWMQETKSEQQSAARTLVHHTMMDFARNVPKGSFEDFYATTAKAWQRQVTVAQINAAFAPFVDQQVNLGGLRDMSPILDTPPSLDSAHGLLLVSGHYASTPLQVVFTMKYLVEEDQWKPYGIEVNVKPAASKSP